MRNFIDSSRRRWRAAGTIFRLSESIGGVPALAWFPPGEQPQGEAGGENERLAALFGSLQVRPDCSKPRFVFWDAQQGELGAGMFLEKWVSQDRSAVFWLVNLLGNLRRLDL